MKTHLGTLFLLGIALTVSLTACEDPSNVGIGLVGDQGGNPILASIPVENFATEPLTRPNDVPLRVLTGVVDDPLIGRIAAAGYMDFTSVASSDFRGGSIASAELRLRPTYVYGDTTGDMTFAVRPVTEEVESDGLPVDTSFSVGAVILEFTFHPSDSLVVVPLPESWVAEHDEIIRSDDFADEFHGFRFDHVSGNAVIGFGPASTVLRSRTEDDSASFPVGTAYAALQKDELPISGERFSVQAGTGPSATFTLDLVSDTLTASAINRIALTFWTDTLAVAQDKPAGFVRPRLTTLNLYGNTTEGGLAFLDQSTMDEKGRFIFDSDILARELQNVLLGLRTFENFEFRIPSTGTVPPDQNELAFLSSSISVALFHDTGTGETSPVGYLTVTPTDG